MNKTESITEGETENYVELSLSQAPKKNHDAMEQIGKPFVQWLKNQGVRTEIYHLSTSEVTEGLESIQLLFLSS